MMNTWTLGTTSIYFTRETYVLESTPAVQAWVVEDEYFAIPYACISANIPEAWMLREGQFYLKDWSENREITAAMIAEGLIEQVEPLVQAHSGFITARAYQFTEKGKQFCSK